VITRGRLCTLHNANIGWIYIQELLTIALNNYIALQTDDDIICAIENFNHAVQQTAWNATDMQQSKHNYRMFTSNKK